jgi:hypothetical protein
MLAKLQARKQRLVQLNVLVAGELRDKLRKAAKRADHSLNTETAMRLGRTFAEDEMLGGKTGRTMFLNMAARFLTAGDNAAGGKTDISLWISQPQPYTEAMSAVMHELISHLPPGVAPEALLALAESLKTRIGQLMVNRGMVR